jgi:hypothetical protein
MDDGSGLLMVQAPIRDHMSKLSTWIKDFNNNNLDHVVHLAHVTTHTGNSGDLVWWSYHVRSYACVDEQHEQHDSTPLKPIT